MQLIPTHLLCLKNPQRVENRSFYIEVRTGGAFGHSILMKSTAVRGSAGGVEDLGFLRLVPTTRFMYCPAVTMSA